MQVLQENANIPAFLGKLWKMVNDPQTNHLICWSQAGNTFIIQNEAQFWYELLPLHYKHNNMSSFVRQLNLYGFHKVSSLENFGKTPEQLNSEKEDIQTIQFYHPFFQRGKPEKLIHIKRKGSGTKTHDVPSAILQNDITKVLTDVKHIRGRQSSLDSQLSAMKQENAVLWRELAILRQKHMKQQQIVNKLIQFLVTLVQPNPSPRMGVGVKRHMPLMLHESPGKKTRSRKNRQSSDAGPTIHELEPEVDLSAEELLEEASGIEAENLPLEAAVSDMGKSTKIDSPITPASQVSQDSLSMTSPLPANDVTSNQRAESSFWYKPEFAIEDSNEEGSDNDEELINTLQKNALGVAKVFVDPTNSGTRIGSLMNSGNFIENTAGSMGKNIGNDRKPTNEKPVPSSTPNNSQVATRSIGSNGKISSSNIRSLSDLDLHLDNTEHELDQLKDILDGCNSFSANTLLGLFTDNDPDYALTNAPVAKKENPSAEDTDPIVSGNEVATTANLLDFNELFDDDLNSADTSLVESASPIQSQSGLQTPMIIKHEPTFPST